MRSVFRTHRLERGWRLRDLSEECAKHDVPPPSTSHLSLIERGIVTPRPPLRKALACVLDLPGGVEYFDEEPANEVSA